jgi:hypothetical protein
MQPRVERMVHSMLTSRVLLHIRAQAGDNPVWSDGLTELNTIHLFHTRKLGNYFAVLLMQASAILDFGASNSDK